MRRLFTWAAVSIVLLGLSAVAAIGATLFYFSHDLPDYRQLAEYDPVTASRVYASDGRLLAEYATERRVFISFRAVPRVVIDAFLAAEDRNFYSHPGVDLVGILRASISNIRILQEGGALQGASTITQQVAKNMLLTSERTLSRKIKEAILAFRMSKAYSKDRILELYLNEIYLGSGSYGIAAASLNYFNKSVDDLTLEEAALLAALPKAPSIYDPRRNYDKALERRNWVLSAMAQEGFISHAKAHKSSTTPITLRSREEASVISADYYTEEVRRRLLKRFGSKTVYEGGLTAYTTLDPVLQTQAEGALRRGLAAYERRHGYRGPLAQVGLNNWSAELASITAPIGAEDWELAAILGFHDDRMEIGFADRRTGFILLEALKWVEQQEEGEPSMLTDVLKPGDVILVERQEGEDGNAYGLRQIPEVSGALVVIEPKTGKVRAIVGGFSYQRSQFNRAVQAMRQPGSAFKPFVYLAAMETGLSPADRIADEPIEFGTEAIKPEDLSGEEAGDAAGEKSSVWAPQNYTGNFYGPTTLRHGLEESLNVMTVHLGIALGLDKIFETAERFGIYRNPPRNMATVLGAAETNLLALTNAYAMLVNGGKKVDPYFVERVQNRHGKVIYNKSVFSCSNCSFTGPETAPVLQDVRAQITDPVSAYQVVSMLEGVVQRGTARRARSLKKIVAGKTGTTNNNVDSWFIGFSPDLVAGIYVGFDKPHTLGKKEQGASVALPIFIDFMEQALQAVPSKPFAVPDGVKLVAIDRKTGLLPSEETRRGDIISEAFRPGTEPKRMAREEEILNVINPPKGFENDKDSDRFKLPEFKGTGGIY